MASYKFSNEVSSAICLQNPSWHLWENADKLDPFHLENGATLSAIKARVP